MQGQAPPALHQIRDPAGTAQRLSAVIAVTSQSLSHGEAGG